MEYSKKANVAKQNNDGETKVCVKCKRIFNYSGYGHFYCPLCKKRDEEDFTKVKDYIYGNGVASSLEVSEMTGVNYNTIQQYLREGRLEIPEGSPIFIKCEKCAIDIRSGRLCPECATKLSNAMRIEMNFDDEEIGPVPKVIIGKMRFLGKEK